MTNQEKSIQVFGHAMFWQKDWLEAEYKVPETSYGEWKFVYSKKNPKEVDMICSHCGKTLIEAIGYNISVEDVEREMKGDTCHKKPFCPECGTPMKELS